MESSINANAPHIVPLNEFDRLRKSKTRYHIMKIFCDDPQFIFNTEDDAEFMQFFNFMRNRNIYLKKTLNVAPPGKFFADHKDCYLKEARAILANKHWKDKNRCVKLVGD